VPHNITRVALVAERRSSVADEIARLRRLDLDQVVEEPLGIRRELPGPETEDLHRDTTDERRAVK
jgi:hypothetical protein